MRKTILYLLCLMTMLSAVTRAAAEQTELLWEQRFDVEALPEGVWTLDGEAALEDGALRTRTHPGKHSSAKAALDIPLPSGDDGYLLRVEWSLIPVRIGGWGQDARIESGPFVVEFTGTRPTLNARHSARDTVEAGREVTLSCDFNLHQVFSWRIGGKEQLDRPVPAWMTAATMAHVGLYDWIESNSESRWLWVRVSRVIPDDTLPLRLSAWDAPADLKPDEPTPFLLGQASPMDKVFREAGDFRGSYAPHVSLAAAGHEYESFQLVVIPLGQSLTGVTAAVTDLVHTESGHRIEKSHIAWNPVGYVQTRPSNSAIRRTGWWWPDILMPAEPFEVAAGFVQPVWFTVYVPAGTPPGTYRGLVELRAEGTAPRAVGVEVLVRDFALPVRGALKTAFCISPGLWEIWYEPDEVKRRLGMTDETGHGPLYTSYECEDVLPREKWLEMYDFLLAHRLSPTSIYSGLKNGRSRVVPREEDLDYCYERGMNATCLVNVDMLPSDPEAADARMRDLEAWLAHWEKIVQEKNWPDFTWYVHGFDESEMRPNPEETIDPSIRRVMGMIGERFPWLKRETANPFVAKHEGLFDIWTPVTYQLRDEHMETYRERRNAGEEVWAYVCCGPGKPYANLFIDFPGVDPRVLSWQFRQYGLTGFLYYLINLYEYQKNWNMDAPKWPELPWNPLSFSTNSDGILIYPGPDATPLASVRLANLRDGIEDYEALALLEGLAMRLEKNGGHEERVAAARAALAIRPEVSVSWTQYTQEPSVIAGARREVDDLIEEFQRLLAEGPAPAPEP